MDAKAESVNNRMVDMIRVPQVLMFCKINASICYLCPNRTSQSWFVGEQLRFSEFYVIHIVS